MLILKPEVNPNGVCREIWYALGVCDAAMRVLGRPWVLVNSLNDGDHMKGSKHFTGQAADVHTIHLTPGELAVFNARVNELLNPLGFDVVPESNPVHTHIEFDPKGGEHFIHAPLEERRADGTDAATSKGTT